MHVADIRIPRQTALLGAGLGLVATVLAACTTYGRKPEAPGAETAPAPGGPAAPENVITKTADVPVGSGVVVDDIVVTQPSPGVFKGFSAICTHAGCAVKEVADGTINCPCHGSRFNLNGSVAAGPAPRPLESKAVTVQGDSVVLD